MSNINVYFGVQPSAGQIVSESLSAKGIELLKQEPAKMIVTGGPTTVQPGFSLYRSFLPLYIRSALNKETYSSVDTYGPIPFNKITKTLPIPFPDLCVTWRVPIGEEVRAQMREHGFEDTIVRGKPAMVARRPGPTHVKAALDRLALTTSPSVEGAVNIRDLRRCSLILKIVQSFLAVHQYPAFIDEEHESEFVRAMMAENPTVGMEVDDEEDENEEEEILTQVEFRPVVAKQQFKVILPNDPTEQPLFYDEHSIPKGQGLLFPYVPELAKFDRYTVVDTIKKYFFAGLGDTVEACTEEFNNIVQAWGNIQNSSFGNVMSHIYKVIDISMTTQCCLHIMMTASNYDGIFMRGAGFRVEIGGKAYGPASAEEIDQELPKMDSHANAFWAILQDIDMLEDARLNFFRTVRTIWGLKHLIDSQKIAGGTGVRDRVKKNARNLRFPDDRYVVPTAVGIQKALSYIADQSKDIATLGGLYPPFLFETDRITLVMGCFGDTAPSFRVPGGKEMFLNKPFRITNAKIKAEKGPQGFKDIVKIAAHMVAVETAITDMRQVISVKTVLNPFGNYIVPKSSSHISKEFEGESAQMLIAALRGVAQVTVVDEGSGKRKDRDHDDEANAGPSKKGRVEFDF